MSEPKDRPDARGAIDVRLADSVEVVRAYAGSDQSLQAVAMLRALEEGYVEDLKNATVDDLVRLQSLIRQTVALREVFENVGAELPRV